jgi:hypothetical protein
MDYLTIILATLAAMGVIGLAFFGGWELGNANGADVERAVTKPRIDGLLAEINKLKPRVLPRKRRTRK